MIAFDATAPVPHWNASTDRGAVLAFSTRAGGVSRAPFDTLNLGRSTEDDPEAVMENRRRFLQTLGLDRGRLSTAGQVHGARAVEVTGAGHVEACDALWTRTPGVALAVTAADCMPILYRAPGVVAAAHAGWRGIAGRLPRLTLDAIVTGTGHAPADVVVALGPCIRACCYVVQADVARRFGAKAVQRRDGALHLDLITAVRDQLLDAGIRKEAISDAGVCTACDVERCFSHRRDHGRTGRMWGVVAIRDGTPEARTAHERARV